MNKLLTFSFFISVFFFIPVVGFGASPVTFGPHEKLVKVCDLPDTEEYKSSDGKLFDFGYKYTLFDVFYLPIFEKGEGEIVGYIDDDNYVLLSENDIQTIAKENKITNLAGMVKLPFWDEWGGKITAITLVSILVYLDFRHRRRNNE